MQKKLFIPAISVLNRLNYTRKFTLLWLMSLIAVAVVGYSLFVSLERIIQPSQRQLQGLALIKPISQTIQSIQLHRGISAALLGGNEETLRDRRAATEKEAATRFNALQEKLPAGLAAGEDFRDIQANWARLRQEGLNWTMEANFAAHTSLVEQLQSFEVLVADEYLLTLDSEIASYYLMMTAINELPHALEHLGQIRAYGTGMLVKQQITEHQHIKLNTLMAELDTALKVLRVNLDKTGRHNPSVRDALHTTSDDIAHSARQITDLVKSDILTGRFTTSHEAFLEVATAVIDQSYTQMHDSMLPTAEILINARIARAKNTLYTNVGIALLAFLLVVYLSVSIYYAIVGNIQSLVRSARAFADGDLSTRVRLDTSDELSWVGDSFNQMADGFNKMLETHREDEVRLRATIETAMDAVVQMDTAGIIIGWNSQAEKIFGWSREEALGRVLSETIIPPQYREAHVNGLKRFLLSGEGAVLNSRIEVTGLQRDGHEFPVELSIASIKAAGNYEFSAFIRDITQQKESEELIWNQANFDTLTGLPNRHMFHDRLTQDIRKAHRASLKTALLFIDLDKFKEVNDTLGHSMG
ncbi:MAG: PAS domain S-box protein, partial [Sideroxyarcus sp.]|nr:PAS domain S-box protein [Sideroxyarcus sp.]